jgi:hypothetical protein
VIFGAASVVGQYPVKNTEQVTRFDGQSSLFESFAHGRFAEGLTDFQHAPRDGPFAGEWRMAALDQHNTIPLDDDGSDSDERLIWIFTFHGMTG